MIQFVFQSLEPKTHKIFHWFKSDFYNYESELLEDMERFIRYHENPFRLIGFKNSIELDTYLREEYVKEIEESYNLNEIDNLTPNQVQTLKGNRNFHLNKRYYCF